MATLVTTRPSPASMPRTASPAPPHLTLNTTQRGTPVAIPHKHIPYCSPGPRPANNLQLSTPPASPPSASQLIETTSITYPPTGFPRLSTDPPVYGITAARLEEALDHLASQPLPAAGQVFPWLHGLHADNQLQLAFFIARKRSLRKTPTCIRGLTVVKARGDLSHSKLKGAIAPEELLRPCAPASPRRRKTQPQPRQAPREEGEEEGEEDGDCHFLDIDPRDGFSVRNFQIQACKMATVSDLVVYGDLETPRREVEALAARLARAQAAWQRKIDPKGLSDGEPLFNTFVLTDDYDYVETDHPNLVALDADGCMTTKVMDFFHWERLEMYTMSAPTQISHNVWLGPTPEPGLMAPSSGETIYENPGFDFMIEASDLADIPDDKALRLQEEILEQNRGRKVGGRGLVASPHLEFPGSGSILPPTWSHEEVDGLMATCEWIYKQTHSPGHDDARHRRDSKLSLSPPTRDADGDVAMSDSANSGRRILIHCSDGYTESSLLALAYYMYAECAPVHEAWLALHVDKKRNFFAYASDVALLRSIEPRILAASPHRSDVPADWTPQAPAWLDALDGSLPSRVLDYMYLGNLTHANNPALLKELGIGQVLSVGEPVSWSREEQAPWGADELLFVDRVQDNGVDPLMEEFGRCLEFIEAGRRKGTATLVHCRVGVSRSATICIAEVMNELGLSFPRAYCFVRARRLNVIIQPHLRFCYELLKWEEFQCEKRGRPLRRELEWATIAREIAAMNKPYSKQK